MSGLVFSFRHSVATLLGKLRAVSVNEPVRILESPLDIFESSNAELGALSSHEVKLEVFSSLLPLVLQDQIQQGTTTSFHRKRYKHVYLIAVRRHKQMLS